MVQEEKLCDTLEGVRELAFLGDRVSVDGGCEAAVTAITRYGWVAFRECGEMLYDGRFSLMLQGLLVRVM